MGNHYVPQHYLRGFTDPSSPNALWQFDKEKLSYTERPASIAKIAQQRSFYDAETERRLTESVEFPANRVLDKLRSGELALKDEERLHLAAYIATMLKRVPGHRAKFEAMAPGIFTEITSELREEIQASSKAGIIPTEIAEQRLAETDAAEARFATEIPDNVREQIRSPWPTDRVIKIVYDMHWRFVCSEGSGYFLTTDNPAFFFDCYGLGTENSEFTFPVSRSLAIFGSWTPVADGNGVSRRAQFVKEANRRLISAAYRFIYSRDRPAWIRTAAAKKQPYLSRIRW